MSAFVVSSTQNSLGSSLPGQVGAHAPEDSAQPKGHHSQPPSPLLQVKDLRLSFATNHGDVEAVAGLSLTIHPGEIVALVGESGSGKSATARALVGLAGENARVSATSMTLGGEGYQDTDLLTLTERQWRNVRGRRIGVVLQDALVALDPLRTVGREVGEPLLTHRLVKRAEVAARVEVLLTDVGVPDAQVRAAQRPHELSGGLRQRALIASALAGGPDVLIADEPTTALDAGIRRRILQLFREVADQGKGVLLISHDLSAVAHLADRVLVMKAGRIVEAGPVDQVLGDPRHDYTKALLAAVPSAATRGRRLSRESRVTAPGQTEGQIAEEVGQSILQARDVSVSFRLPGGAVHQAVSEASLVLRRGQTTGLVGGSGSGKTTLGRAILGLTSPDAGEVTLDGGPWSTLKESQRRPLRHRIQPVSQDPLGSFDPRHTVAEVIGAALRLYGASERRVRAQRVTELLHDVGLPPESARRRPRQLSGGQRQRVAIARALAADPDILVCDEAVSALDTTTQAQVLDLLVDLQRRRGLALLFISHDLGVIAHLSHNVAVMKDGRIVEQGRAEKVLGSPEHPYTQELLSALPYLAPGPGLGEDSA